MHKAVRFEALVRIHGECLRLMGLRTVAQLRLGQICRALQGCYHTLGFSSFTVYCLDRLGQDSREVRRAMQLAAGLERFPHLRAAFLEGRLGEAKALALLPHLVSETEEVQVELATRLTVRALREEYKEPGQQLFTRTYRLCPQEYQHVLDAIELCRIVAGQDLTQSQAWEYICADLLAGAIQGAEVELPHRRRRSRLVEEHLEETYRGWDFLGARLQPVTLLERELPRSALALEREALDLLHTLDCWQPALAQLLVELEDRYETPCFRSASHFAEECLQLSGSQARALMLRERRLRQRPELRDPRLSPSKLDLLWPLFDRGVEAEPWIAFAARTTCKVLRRWTEQLLALPWSRFQEWMQRAPDTARCPPAWLLTHWLRRTSLDATLLIALNPMAGLMTHVESLLICQTLSAPAEPLTRFRVQLDADAMRNVLSLEVALDHPYAAGVISLAFVNAHQDGHQLKGQQKRLLFRDRFTCCAPGCTRKCNLHSHHIVFRSQGGSNADANQITLCSPCHLRLVHRGYLRISGTASWLVVERAGERFLNELRVDRRKTVLLGVVDSRRSLKGRGAVSHHSAV